MRHPSLSILAVSLILASSPGLASAQSIPQSIPYTGSVAVNGIPFNGNGQFKFAIVNQSGTTTYWSNDGTSNAGAEPTSAVTVVVSNGLYALELGNPDRANMQVILPAVFNTPLTFLRVWFSDGVNGFQLLSPDRQLVSVPYAFQAEKANEVSGTNTVVKSLEIEGIPYRDDVVFVGGGNVVVQPKPGSPNTIEIVGSTGNASAVALNCSTPCVEPAEISGPLTDALIPDLGTLSGGITDAQIPGGIARDSEVSTAITNHSTATGAHTLSSLAGSVTDSQIPATITRDSEVPGFIGTTVSDAITTHSNAAGAHTLSALAGSVTDAQVPDLGTLSGVLTDAQIPDLHTLSGVLLETQIPAAIARDSEVTAGVSAAIAAHSIATGAHTLSSLSGSVTDAQVPDLGTLSGVLVDAQIPSGIARDSEVAAAVDAVANAAATNVACATPCVSPAEISGPLTDALIPDLGTLSGVLADAQVPSGIARDTEVPTLIGTVVKTITPSGGIPMSNDIVLTGAGTIDIQQAGNTITIVGTAGPAAATDLACATPCVSPAEISGPLTDALIPDLGTLDGVLVDPQIPAAIARDSELPTWTTLSGIPAGFADDIDDVGVLAEIDPQVGAISDNRVPRWSNTAAALVNGQIYDTGSAVGIGTTTPATALDVAGTVTVVALAASYVRVNNDHLADPGLNTFTATCPIDSNVLGGGVNPQGADGLTMTGSWPNTNNSWSVTVNNSNLLGSLPVTVYAVCAAIQ